MSIVKFKSKAAGDIVMFRDNAEQLLKIMGKELGERGVIQPAELPQAYAQLVAAVNHDKLAHSEPSDDELEDLDPHEKEALRNKVSLAQRAYPLLKMLEAAQAKAVDVHWGF